MALLGYDSPTTPSWQCGGTLINDQYVLTAAHCIDERFTFGRKVAVVRLGEYNIGTATDCEIRLGSQFCAPPPQDFRPAEIIVHPTFHQRTNVSDDIALIRLDRKAPLGAFIKPICLPSSPAEVLSIPRAEVAGWGLTEAGTSAQILQSASLPFVDKATCNPHFENKLVPEQICFGGGKQDSCQGDSGGPTFVDASSSTPRQVGIVSFGKRGVGCGTVGTPAVYTHVAAYRSWITSHLRP